MHIFPNYPIFWIIWNIWKIISVSEFNRYLLIQSAISKKMCKWRFNVILITNCSYFVKVPSWLKRCSIWCTPFKNCCLQKTYLLLIHIDSLNHIRLKRDSSLSVHFLSSKNGTKTSFQNRFLKVLKIDIVIFFQELSYLKHLGKYSLTRLSSLTNRHH